MTQGFYYSKILNTLVLLIKNTSLNKYTLYRIDSPTRIGHPFDINPHSIFWESAQLLIPFDHYPTFEELEQFPELFI